VERRAECATCPWLQVCRGYFKWPDPGYSCRGVKQLFSIIEAAASEIGRELDARETQPQFGASA
jgi:sulfatase maturation enzyme AslB (radical SAM superfamily)